MSYKIYKSLGHSHTRARKNRKVMNSETVFWHFFPLQRPLLVSLLQPYSPDWRLLFRHRQCQRLIISTAGTFSHVYVWTRHINKHQYRFYASNYFDFTLLSIAKMTANMTITKIWSMTEIIQNFWSLTSITLVVTLATRFLILSPRRPF